MLVNEMCVIGSRLAATDRSLVVAAPAVILDGPKSSSSHPQRHMGAAYVFTIEYITVNADADAAVDVDMFSMTSPMLREVIMSSVSTANYFSNFGSALAISDEHIVVGADLGERMGAAFVYENSESTSAFDQTVADEEWWIVMMEGHTFLKVVALLLARSLVTLAAFLACHIYFNNRKTHSLYFCGTLDAAAMSPMQTRTVSVLSPRDAPVSTFSPMRLDRGVLMTDVELTRQSDPNDLLRGTSINV